MATGSKLKARIALLAFTLLLFCAITSAWWSEKIDVYVYDLGLRPLKGATATVVYQSTSCGQHVQISKVTDEVGKAHFEFQNTIPEEAVTGTCVERYYTILGDYLGASNSTIGYVNLSAKTFAVIVPVVQYNLRITGIGGIVLPGAYVNIGNKTFPVDGSSVAHVGVPAGKQADIEVVYGSVIKGQQIRIGGDTSAEIQLPIYNLRVRLYDENGNRIAGFVKAGDSERWTTETEDAFFEKFPYESVTFIVTANSTVKEIPMHVTSGLLEVYFDFSPPAIRDVGAVAVEKKNVRVSASVFDEGKYASGLSGSPTLSYSFVGTGTWTDAKMYPSAAHAFGGEIPAHGTDVLWRVTASDKLGNSASVSGNYSFGPAKKEEVRYFEVKLEYIIGVIVFLVVIFVIYRKIREEII